MKRRSAGIALIVAGLTLLTASSLELAAGEGRGDGDNPAESLQYLAEFGLLYSYSGLALVVGGVLLVVSVLGVLRLSGMPSLAYGTASVFGALAGGFLTVSGVMRMQAYGTVPHIQSLNQSWGESAYLAVQMAGTQGLLSTGMMGLAAWLVALSILLFRQGLRVPVVLAVFPVVVLLILAVDLAFPSLDAPEEVFLVYISSAILGIPVCCVGLGVALLTQRARSRLAAAGS